MKKIDQIIVILKEIEDEKELREYVEELSLYIDSAAPKDLKAKVLERIKTEIITGVKKMSSIKDIIITSACHYSILNPTTK